ncbi:MAG TPA: hypothetical protein VFX65_11545 [Candidatus Limnocylindrales bacterium]|nr:hypothetical protein [Candidatus Limnocylindrales bacterium]
MAGRPDGQSANGIVRLTPGERDRDDPLLARYAPELVVLPEDLEEPSPPGPTSGHDFHPRSARLFADHARSVRRRGRMLTGAAIALSARRGDPNRGVGTTDAGSPARRRLEAAWPDRLAGECLTASGRVDAGAAWRRYRDLLRADSGLYPRTVYGRVVGGDDRVAVQYWLFWFHNAWHNDHEADWEVVTVLHETSSGGPIALSASAHGHAPRWSPGELTWVDGRPLLYVAAGSHALYAEPEPGIDRGSRGAGARARTPASLTQLARGSTRDHVAGVEPDRAIELPAMAYELRHFPDLATLRPGTDAWDDWWWLAYGGRWGRASGPAGPAGQGPAWDDPLTWVAAATTER